MVDFSWMRVHSIFTWCNLYTANWKCGNQTQDFHMFTDIVQFDNIILSSWLQSLLNRINWFTESGSVSRRTCTDRHRQTGHGEITDWRCITMKNGTIFFSCIFFLVFFVILEEESQCCFSPPCFFFWFTGIIKASFILWHCCLDWVMFKTLLIFSCAWLLCEQHKAGPEEFYTSILSPHTSALHRLLLHQICNWTWDIRMGSADARCILKLVLSHWTLS